jgi:uncharacterized protein YcbK (DUF882 family)
MNEELMTKVDKAREIAGMPFNINSGFRCVAFNTRLTKGQRSTGRHTRGEALDFEAIGAEQRAKIIFACREAGLVSFEIGKKYIHVDLARTPWIGLV